MNSTAIDLPGLVHLPARGLLSRTRVSLAFVVLALLAVPFADLSISGHDPWAVLRRMFTGLLAPDFSAIEGLGQSAALTVAFAFAGLTFGVVFGGCMAVLFDFAPVRWFAACLRSVHELIWALLLMAVTGPTVTTGVMALGLAYSGIFAKVYAELLDEADARPADVLPPGTHAVSRFAYARVAVAMPALRIYTLYRLECALRSSAVLGFIGLPTLGFQLDSFFKQGSYGAVAAVLIIYFSLIATLRLWMWRPLIPLYLAGSFALLALNAGPAITGSSLYQVLTHDIVPAPLRNGDILSPDTLTKFGTWLADLLLGQAVPGVWSTLLVSQIALALTGVVAVLAFPLIVTRFAGRFGSVAGHFFLVMGRSTPEYMLAYLLLQVFGPSMLPAVLALAFHNGCIIAHLMGRQADEESRNLRLDAPGGTGLYFYELMPRLYGQFLALCLYRWEIILRESAILGILGVTTLGFYVDSAISELRLDRAVMLLAVTAILTLSIDTLSRSIRARLQLKSVAASC